MRLPAITLSATRIDPASSLRRHAARPAHLQNESYAQRYDWDTLFYDVYRVGARVVLQGPPFLNLLDPLKASAPFGRAFGFPRFAARHIGEKKRGEIWLRSAGDTLHIDGPIGRYAIAVQPDMAPLFAGRRVITTLSKDNDLRWIADWVRFYARLHGADGVLLYDNGSTAYTLADLQATLDEASGGAFPALAVSWPFAYGPQGGPAGAVNGPNGPEQPDWDSDFCQTGMLQHARHRFLREARGVLNVDIDELVLDDSGQSIFAAAEQARSGMIKFPGLWIANAAAPHVTRANCRHADFVLRDLPDEAVCPPKWCIVPGKADKMADSWSVHNVFGARGNRHVSSTFAFRHMRGISNSWKEDRWGEGRVAMARLPRDHALEAAFDAAGLAEADTVQGTVVERSRIVVR